MVFPIRNHAFENAIGRDRSIEGRADNTRPVLFRRDQPGNGRAVKVGTSRLGIGVIAAIVELAGRVVIAVEVEMIGLDAVIDHAHTDPGPRIVIPNAGDVDIDAGNTAELSGVQ